MSRAPRRLRNLDLEMQDTGPMQEGGENLPDNEEENNLQNPPDIDDILARMPRQSSEPITIIWPNGEKRSIVGAFGISNLLDLEGGKVMVGTDENGVPNERSASILGQHLGQLAESQTFAPLHIARWDNELFNAHKKAIIKDVEKKFAFPRSTIQLTWDWILRTVNNRWRAYKSKLKKRYFNREERTLEEIIQGRPRTVNEHQWRALVGIWCQETHKKLCAINSRSANEQKNTHTTGRKSHARLKKEMEDQKKQKVHRIELWDAAHKKKSGRYSTNKVKTVMDESFEELRKRKEQNNGNLSAKDFNEVFNEVVAKDLKARGYYDDKYWSQVKVSRGITFTTHSDQEILYQEKVNEMDNKMQRMDSFMNQWLAFMQRKFPEEEWVYEMEAVVNEEDGHIKRRGNTYNENDCGENSIPDIASDNGIDVYSANNVQRPPVQKCTQADEFFSQPPILHDQTIRKKACTENNDQANKAVVGTTLPQDSTMTNMGSRRIKAPHHNQLESRQMEVYLLSMIHKGKFVAKGKLVSTNSKRVIGKTPLGNQFVAVHVEALVNVANGNDGDEELPRPLYDIKTLRDAVDFIIAWPRTHVKRPKSNTNNMHDGTKEVN